VKLLLFLQDHRVLLLVMLVINSVRNFRRMQQQKARQLPKIPIQTILLSRNYPLNIFDGAFTNKYKIQSIFMSKIVK
jgi:hypothetical protein